MSRDMQFFLLSLVAIPVILAIACSAGCASVFDAPTPYEATPVQYLDKNSKELVLCHYVKEGVWLMRVPRNECPGWTPI